MIGKEAGGSRQINERKSSTELHQLTTRQLTGSGVLGPKVVVVVVVGSHKPQVLAQTSRTEATTPLIMCGEEGKKEEGQEGGEKA